MNYERLTQLADLLNKHHGKENAHGFVISPENERLQAEHQHALAHADRMFNYQLIGSERLGILVVTREVIVKNGASTVHYTHTRLEEADHNALRNDELAAMLEEYMEYKQSQRMEY